MDLDAAGRAIALFTRRAAGTNPVEILSILCPQGERIHARAAPRHRNGIE